jgi:hypothetical protein
MSSELSSRLSAEVSLDAKTSTAISSEISSRISADSSLDGKTSTAMSSEISSRLSADSSLALLLGNDVSVEASVRLSADTSLETRLNNEEVTRTMNTNDISDRFNITPVAYAYYVGNGATSSYTVGHNLSTKDVIVQVFEVATGATVETETVRLINEDQVLINFNVIPSQDEYRVVIMGIKAFGYSVE